MTMTMPETAIQPETDMRWLIGAEESTAITHTIQRDHPEMTDQDAARILNEAIKFVATGAKHPDHGMRPSPAVDLGWHALILHTHTYAHLCRTLGTFVHHQPDAPSTTEAQADAIDQTRELMTRAGFTPDPTLWPRPEAPAASGGDETPPCCSWCDPTNKPKPKQ